MHPQISATLEDAAALLRTYTIALREDGLEVAELLNANISHHHIAALYPHSSAAWKRGVSALAWSEPETGFIFYADGKTEERQMRKPIRPPALTKNGWITCRTLTRSLSPEIPYFTDQVRTAYRMSAGSGGAGDDVELHLHLIIMLLHVLAASPSAAAELGERITCHRVRQMLTAAAALAAEPKFQSLQAAALNGAA